MDHAELERLVEVVQNANIRELTLRNGNSRITIRKAATKQAGEGALVSTRSDDWELSDVEFAGDLISQHPDTEAAPTPTVLVTAPAVGIFRHIKPLVGLAAFVQAGQLMGQIEAIRLYTEVLAPQAGQIVDLFIEDGMAVEYGQALFALAPEAL